MKKPVIAYHNTDTDTLEDGSDYIIFHGISSMSLDLKPAETVKTITIRDLERLKAAGFDAEEIVLLKKSGVINAD